MTFINRLAASIQSWIRDRYWRLYPNKKKSYDVDGNAYSIVFLSKQPSYGLVVDSRVWDCTKRLPEGYTIPDRFSLRVLQPMTANHYKSLFSDPSPEYRSHVDEVIVDHKVWGPISSSVPRGFHIPDPTIVNILRNKNGPK